LRTGGHPCGANDAVHSSFGTPCCGGEVRALSVERVSHSYRARRALDDVSLTVQRGRVAALLGLNGAGNTTLFSLITRLFHTHHGRIGVQGFDISMAPSAALAELGVGFQARTLDLDISVRDNLIYHAALHGMRGRAPPRCV
jgi:ABC-2 type transport system ATP-binding protein